MVSLQDVAYTLQCFMMEYMLPDAPTPDERGPLPKRSPEIMLEIEGDVHNKRVSCHSDNLLQAGDSSRLFLTAGIFATVTPLISQAL